VASSDVPATLDVVNAYIPPTADATQAFLESLQATLNDAGTTVDQTETALGVTSEIVAGQVPDTLDQLNETLPAIMYATEGNLNATLALLSQLNLVDRNVRVQVNEPADQLSANLDYLSQQLRAMDTYLNTDLGLVDEGLAAMSQNVSVVNDQIDELDTLTVQLDQVSEQLRGLDELYDANMDLETTSQYILDLSENVDAINGQIDGFVAMTEQLNQVSEQLRGLDDLYEENVDLETASQMILNLSENTAAVNRQIDDFVVLAGQLEVLSSQLRALEPYSEFPTEMIGQDIMALSKDVGAINQQVDEFVKLSGQLEVLSSQLRAMEPYSEVDYEAISRNLVALSGDMAAINQQIGELVALTGQLEVLSGQLRSLEPYISDVSLGVIGDDIILLSEDVAAINAQAKGFIPLVDQYIAVVDNLNTTVSQTQANLDQQRALAKTVIIIAAIWILLAQLAPLYLGWELVAGRRDRASAAVSTPSPEPEA
jgi:chromosome segregation ATPase